MEASTPRIPRAGFLKFLATHVKALIFLAIVVFAVSSWTWWAMQLWGLPDIGDPFDVGAFQADRVPDERNAFIDYSYAASFHKPVMRKLQADKLAQGLSKLPADWSEASPGWREYVAQSTNVLASWRAGTDKPDAVYQHSGDLSFRTSLELSQELRWMSRLGVAEGMRVEAEGDMAGAWAWYRSALRSSRHLGQHGFPIERMIGAAIHNEAGKALTRWAANPKVDAPLLRRALDEVIAIDAMTVRPSDTIKFEYLLLVAELDDPFLIDDLMVTNLSPNQPKDWCQNLPISDGKKKVIQGARVGLAKDRERSLRLIRLLTANWLAEVEKPPAQRSKMIRKDPTIYEVDSTPPKGLSAKELSEWLDSSLIASKAFDWFDNYLAVIDRERIRQAKLVVHLATELYKREHGKPPESPRELVGPYLKSLPEGYDAVEEPPL